jgi:hypothetical protein
MATTATQTSTLGNIVAYPQSTDGQGRRQLALVLDEVQRMVLTGPYAGEKALWKVSVAEQAVLSREDLAICFETKSTCRVQKAWRSTLTEQLPRDVNVVVQQGPAGSDTNSADGGGLSIPCNKQMLIIHSGYFAQQKSWPATSSHPIPDLHITLNFHDAKHVQEFFNYIHTGEISVRHTNILDLWRLHRFFQVNSLTNCLIAFFTDQLSGTFDHTKYSRDAETVWKIYCEMMASGDFPQSVLDVLRLRMSEFCSSFLDLPATYYETLEFWNLFIPTLVHKNTASVEFLFNQISKKIGQVNFTQAVKHHLLHRVCAPMLEHMSVSFLVNTIRPKQLFSDAELMVAMAKAAANKKMMW